MPTSRVTPSNSLTDVEWNNENKYDRKTVTRFSSKKIKYIFIIITGALTIAILITIATVLPAALKSKSTTTTSTVSISSTSTITNIPTSSVFYTSSSVNSTTTTTSRITSTTETTTVSNTTTATTIETTSNPITSSETTFTTEVTTVSSTITTSETTSSAIISTTSIPLRWNTTGVTVAGISGNAGRAANQLNTPAKISIDSFDSLYIADFNNHRIQKYLLNATTATTEAGLFNATSGSSSIQLLYPYEAIVDSNGNLYVADTNNQRIQLWNAGANFGITVVATGFGGGPIYSLNYPRGVAFDSQSGLIYIADKNNHRILSYSPNTTSTKLVVGGNGQGKNNTQLNNPIAIDFDSTTNSLIIVNLGTHTVVRWVLGSPYWTLITGNINGTAGNSSTELSTPSDVTVDRLGNIYIADTNNHRIQFFPVGSTSGTTIAGVTGVFGSSALLLRNPSSAVVDSQFNLYVSDSINHRIRKFMRY